MILHLPREISFATWERQLCVGYTFDYLEGRLGVSVEVVRLDQGRNTWIDLLVLDDTYSRRAKPGLGDVFRVAYTTGEPPYYTWSARSRGYLARYADARARRG